MRRARCRTSGPPTDTWFPGRGESLVMAQMICRGCPVRAECLEYALDAGIYHGVWGGTSERERRRIRRARREGVA